MEVLLPLSSSSLPLFGVALKSISTSAPRQAQGRSVPTKETLFVCLFLKITSLGEGARVVALKGDS